MVAVGALGTYAVYRLVTNRPAGVPNGEPTYLPSPPLNPLPPGTLPTRESFGSINAIGRGFPPGRMPLTRGQRYRGRIELGLPVNSGAALGHLAMNAPHSDVAAALTRITGAAEGFQEVQVFAEAEARAAGVMPLEQALAAPDPRGGSRWFEATWSGASGVRDIPDRITLLFPTASTYQPATGYMPLAFV